MARQNRCCHKLTRLTGILVTLGIASIIYAVQLHAQSFPNTNCIDSQQALERKEKLQQLSQDFSSFSVENGRQLRDAIYESRAASNVLQQCIEMNNSLLNQLLGDDCSRERYIAKLKSENVQSITDISNMRNETLKTQLMLLGPALPLCK